MAAQQGYQALAFDRPGYGYSEREKTEKLVQLLKLLLYIKR